MPSLKQLAIRGSTWTIIGYGASQALRFGSNLILTRLVAPDVFGLMTLVYVFITGLNLFSDLGIAPSIVQNQRGEEPNFYNTAWTMQLIRGILLWLCCLAIAWPVAQLYAKPILLQLIPVVGLTTLIDGFRSTAVYTLNRHLKVKELSLFELKCQIISLIVTIVLASIYRNVWAIVIANLTASLLQVVWSYGLIPDYRNQFKWDQSAAESIFSFGKWIFISTAVTYLAEQSDRLILGKLISTSTLGIYGIALALSDIPRAILMALSSKVLFPVFSQYANLPRPEFRAKILKYRQPFLLVGVLGVAGLAGFGDLVIQLLYPNSYNDAAWMLPILAIGFWPQILTQTIDQSLFAVGQSRYPAFGSFFKFLYMMIGLPLGFYALGGSTGHGLLGAIIVIAFNDLSFYGIVTYGLWREKLACFKQDLITTLLILCILAMIMICRHFLGLDLQFGYN